MVGAPWGTTPTLGGRRHRRRLDPSGLSGVGRRPAGKSWPTLRSAPRRGGGEIAVGLLKPIVVPTHLSIPPVLAAAPSLVLAPFGSF